MRKVLFLIIIFAFFISYSEEKASNEELASWTETLFNDFKNVKKPAPHPIDKKLKPVNARILATLLAENVQHCASITTALDVVAIAKSEDKHPLATKLYPKAFRDPVCHIKDKNAVKTLLYIAYYGGNSKPYNNSGCENEGEKFSTWLAALFSEKFNGLKRDKREWQEFQDVLKLKTERKILSRVLAQAQTTISRNRSPLVF